MTIKEQLLQEIENTPPSMLREILNFVQFIKTKQPQPEIKTLSEDSKQEFIKSLQGKYAHAATSSEDFARRKQEEDFMNFAGMASEIDDTMQEIIEDAETNRKPDLSQADILSQADKLRQRLKDTYGVFPDSVELIREDRDR
jgi:hypothetical protein